MRQNANEETTRDIAQTLQGENGQFLLQPEGTSEQYVVDTKSGQIQNIQRIGPQREQGWNVRRLKPDEANKLLAA